MKKYAKVAPASLSQPETKEGEMEDVDDNKSEASSALSDVKEEESEEVISSKHAARMARQSKFIAHRNQVRDAILKDVMAAILPDAGAYDLDGMVKAKARTKDTKLVAFLKMIGLVDLDLHESVIAGYEGKVKKAVNKLMKGKNANPALINQYNGDGRTPLIVACMLTSSKSVNILVDNHALVDVCEETTGRTPLMYSVMGRALDISNKLLSHKASVDMADFKCITPLMIACSKNDLKHVKLLCSHWADVDLQVSFQSYCEVLLMIEISAGLIG